MFPTIDDCDECTAPLGGMNARSLSAQPFSAIAVSTLPFFLTFAFVSTVVLFKLFPYLAGQRQSRLNDEHYLPSSAPSFLRNATTTYESKRLSRRFAAVSFSTTIALSTVLAELLLCEISNTLNPAARGLALRITVPTLLLLLIIIIPFLELQSFIRGAGWEFNRDSKGILPKTPWLLQAAGFTAWLICFWYMGKVLPGLDIDARKVESITNGSLSRIGVIGISLMALLSGFASVSSPWQSFGARQRIVTESDIARKQAGVDATNEMLVAKRSRLRALQRKMSDAPPAEGFMTKVMGTIRGNADVQERKGLQLEISGLETMALDLEASLSMLQTRYAALQRAKSPLGKAMVVPNYLFSIYCLYRVIATILTTLHRWNTPTTSFSNSDPINRVLGLFAKHWDPTLDQAAWSQQISFALSGVILLASFNSVITTFQLFTRWTPGILHQAQANLALIVSQISATYVISSALLLRSNLPREVGSVISEALGTPLDGAFVDRWFEGWFLMGAVATAIGIWLGRKFGRMGGGEDWDDFADVELGQKRS